MANWKREHYGVERTGIAKSEEKFSIVRPPFVGRIVPESMRIASLSPGAVLNVKTPDADQSLSRMRILIGSPYFHLIERVN